MKRQMIFTIGMAVIIGTTAIAQTTPAPPNANARPGTITGFTPGAVSGFTPNAASGFTSRPIQGFTPNPVHGLSTNIPFAPTPIAPLTDPIAGVRANNAQILPPLPRVNVPPAPVPNFRTNLGSPTNRIMTPLF